jgi:hypothetical protein
MSDHAILRKPARRDQVTIPEPYEDLPTLRAAAMANKELTETLAGQRGQAYDAAVTWRDLLELGLISKEQIPTDIGSVPL